MLFDIRDNSLNEIIRPGAVPEVIASGYTVTEGTVWHPRDNFLVFSELVSSTVYKWSPEHGLSVLRTPSNITNGNFFDQQGRLVSCEHATNCVSRLEEDGRYFKVLASHFEGVELNSPNDLVVDSKDRIWFTDPTYGRTHSRVAVVREPSQPVRGVYRLDPDGSLHRVADDFAQPNGLCFTPDEKDLLVNDTDRKHIRRFRVRSDGSLVGGDVFATISGEGEGKPDGMKVDLDGRVYCTGPGGVHVVSPGGDLLGIIRMPEHTRNFCFGGPEYDQMFFATSSAILGLQLAVRGIAPGLAT